MVKKHLKRLAAPKIWQIKRKHPKFVVKPSPGPHSLGKGIPLTILLKEVLNCANNTREVKKILNANEIKIDGKIRNDFRFPVGLFDTLEFIKTKEYNRFVLDDKGKINLVKIKKEEASIKPCKIIQKTIVKGRLQLNLFDSKNILVDKNSYKVGDSILLLLPEQKITKHLRLDKKSTIFLIGGKHLGEVGTVEDILRNKIIYKDKKGNLIETLKKYAFVIGEAKPLITLSKDEPNEKHQN